MAVVGAIAEAARREMPVTWDALSGDPRFGGDSSLIAVINYVKESIFGSVITVEAEVDYPLRVIQFAGKLVALELINSGIDFWMNQSLQTTIYTPRETKVYANRAEELRELRKLLLEQTRKLEPVVLRLLPGYAAQKVTSIPRTNTLDDEFVTPSHQEFPRPFKLTERS